MEGRSARAHHLLSFLLHLLPLELTIQPSCEPLLDIGREHYDSDIVVPSCSLERVPELPPEGFRERIDGRSSEREEKDMRGRSRGSDEGGSRVRHCTEKMVSEVNRGKG